MVENYRITEISLESKDNKSHYLNFFKLDLIYTPTTALRKIYMLTFVFIFKVQLNHFMLTWFDPTHAHHLVNVHV